MVFYKQALFIIAIILATCTAGGDHCDGQSLLNKRVSFQANKKPLKDILALVGKQGGFYFSYNSNLIKNDSLITISVHNEPIKDVLKGLLGEDWQYKETDNHIIIQQSEIEKWFSVSGYIVDEKTGEKVSDASVFEVHQLVSTLTDQNGFFRLRLKAKEKYDAAELRVSKGFYVDTAMILGQGYDQEYVIPISPADYALPGVVITQYSDVEKSWFGKHFFSATLRKSSANITKFFVDKPMQVSFTPGLGTHGKMSSQVVNTLSFNVLGGYTAGVNGFELGGVFNIDKKDVRYVQIAGFFNMVTANVEGVQIAGFSNYIRSKATGVQIAGFMNKAGSVEGTQIAGFSNITIKDVKGVQVAGFTNHAINVNAQVAGFINIAKTIDGAQTAGFINVTWKKVKGIQTAGGINFASKIDGMQVAGLMNIGGTVRGVQTAGLINVARKVSGVQIAGLINIADSCDYPIGLLNIVRNGDRAIGMNVDEISTYMINCRTGGRILYSIWGLGLNTRNRDITLLAGQLGMGAHLRLARHFRINNEVIATTMSDIGKKRMQNYSFSVLPSIKYWPLEIFAGPSVNYSVITNDLATDVRLNSMWHSTLVVATHQIRFGYKLGVQIHL